MLTPSTLTLPQGSIAFIENHHQSGQEQVLAIHGWLDNAASFSSLIPLLPNYNWTAIDLPGHGHSFHRPDNTYYHFIDWVSDIVTFIKAKYSEPVTLVGHSLGGMLSTVIAGLYPELISKVVLIDAAGLMTQAKTDGAKELRAALDSRAGQLVKSNEQVVNFKTVLRARTMSGDISQQSACKLLERNLDNDGQNYYWRSDNKLRTRSPIRMHASQAKSIIENISAPVLILLAEDGYPEIKQGFSHYQGHYQDLICVTVAGSHHCHMDEAEQCAQYISRFLK